MNRVVHPGSGLWFYSFCPSRIPYPGVKKGPDPGSATPDVSSFFSNIWFSLQGIQATQGRASSRPPTPLPLSLPPPPTSIMSPAPAPPLNPKPVRIPALTPADQSTQCSPQHLCRRRPIRISAASSIRYTIIILWPLRSRRQNYRRFWDRRPRQTPCSALASKISERIKPHNTTHHPTYPINCKESNQKKFSHFFYKWPVLCVAPRAYFMNFTFFILYIFFMCRWTYWENVDLVIYQRVSWR